MVPYDTVYTGGRGEIVEKKSRFIADVYPVGTEDEVAGYLETVKKQYWDARHHCYAYILGANGEISRCSDDGEPSGTAGRPILEVLAGKSLKNVLVIVTRYFGGTLLGTGGLVRAYSQAAQAGLANSHIITKQVGYRMEVHTDYSGIGKLQYVAAQLQLPVLDTLYTDQVQISLVVPARLCGQAKKEIAEVTAGKAKTVQEKEEIYFAEVGGKTVIFD